MNDSNRTYSIAFIDDCMELIDVISIEEILRNDHSELNYALQSVLDDVLDLKKGESMYFQPNRDNDNSKGIIVRIDI